MELVIIYIYTYYLLTTTYYYYGTTLIKGARDHARPAGPTLNTPILAARMFHRKTTLSGQIEKFI